VELGPADIQEILDVFANSELEELRLEIGTTRLHVSKRQSASGDRLAASSTTAVPPAAPGPQLPAPVATVWAPAKTDEPRAERGLPGGGSGDYDSAREDLYELRSPLLGVFYRRPAPDQPPLIELGSEVSAEDSVCIIDVMKMFTSVPAGANGRVVEICAEDGQLVEFGQVLMRIAQE
jgi:biotin carboxyl carrier protein